MTHPYLAQGEQTRFTPLVREHARQAGTFLITDTFISSLPEPLRSIHQTCRYIRQLPLIKEYDSDHPKGKANQELKNRIFRQRDLDQILQEGRYPTCSDTGILFRGLMAAQGHPTSYVETFHEELILNGILHTHAFAKVYATETPLIVDPERMKTHPNEESIFPYIIVAEGLDSWDLGIRSYDDLHRLRQEHLEELTERYERIRTHVQQHT